MLGALGVILAPWRYSGFAKLKAPKLETISSGNTLAVRAHVTQVARELKL